MEHFHQLDADDLRYLASDLTAEARELHEKADTLQAEANEFYVRARKIEDS